MKILVVQTAFLGDALLSIPLLKSIKNQFPNSELWFLTRKGVGEIFLKSGLVNHCLETDKGSSADMASKWASLREVEFDMIFCPHGSVRSALGVKSLNAKTKIGFKRFWNGFAFSHRVKRNTHLHDVLRQLQMLEPLNVPQKNISESLSLKIDGDPVFRRFHGYVAMAPGSQWKTKMWKQEGFISVGQKLRSNGYKTLLVGAKSEMILCDEIKKQIPEAESLCGKTSIFELAQVLKECRLLICNDSGAMHVAPVVETPVVAIFGPTVQELGYSPWQKSAVVIESDLKCRPCGSHGHNTCPIGTHLCMTKIGSDEVAQSALKLLGS